MAQTLSPQVERWLLTRSAEEIARSVADGKVSMEQLRIFAAGKHQFAAKLPSIESIIDSMPNPQEQADFMAVNALYNSSPYGDETGRKLDEYLRKWKNNSSASEHVAIIREAYNTHLEYREYNRIATQAQNEIERYEAQNIMPRQELADAVRDYLAKWSSVAGVNPTHIDNCTKWNSQLQEIMKVGVDNEWNSLFDSNGILRNPDDLKAFLNKYKGIADYTSAADDKLWEWAMSQPDPVSSSAIYTSFFSGIGKHAADVNNLHSLKAEWDSVDKDDMFSVLQYMDSHPNSPFAGPAKQRVQLLKGYELDMIATQTNYNPAKFKMLYENGIFTRDELMGGVACMDEDFERLINHSRIVNTEILPTPPESEYALGENGNGKTDIVFFGVASSGKTCTLSGLLANDRIAIDSADWGGRYGAALRSWGRARIAPPPTSVDFVSLIKSWVFKGANSQIKIPFNLVDMSGEAFRQRIAGVMTSDATPLSFADMGEGAPQILANDNDKVFFIIVDPSAEGGRKVMQTHAIQALVSLFQQPVNHSVMKKVRGLHFIVTKSDLLKGDTLQKARKLVCDILSEGERTTLQHFCVENGINASNKAENNGRPRVFCFSLGKFIPLNHYIQTNAF